MSRRFFSIALLLSSALADFHPPAGSRYAVHGAAGTILPGGRVLQPYGTELETGPGPLGLAVSHAGKVATADTGYGITIIEPPQKASFVWRERRIAVPGVGSGIAFESENILRVEQGGKIVRVDLRSGKVGRAIDPAPQVAGICDAGTPDCVQAGDGKEFVSRRDSDSIAVVSAATRKVEAEISLGFPGLENYRGVMPGGLAFDPLTKWLFVAEAGINAVGVIDTQKNQVIGQIPAGWMPVAVAVSGDRVFVVNYAGHGTGPRTPRIAFAPDGLQYGSVTTFIVPSESDLAKTTRTVLVANGLAPDSRPAAVLPAQIRHVVLIVKGNHTYDDLIGDITRASNGPVAALVPFARFGLHARARGGHDQFSVQDAAITPNHHAIAAKWAFSDNFYAEGQLAGDSLWSYLDGKRISVYRSERTSVLTDEARVGRIIDDLGKQPIPQFIYIELPGDALTTPNPQQGYPYDASYVAENDLALGRLMEYLTRASWWPETAVFVTESGTEDGLDHVDSHRTLLLAAGPYVQRNYVSHTNSNFPGLMKTVFELLGVPPLDLFEATASDLRDMFTLTVDNSAYAAQRPDIRVLPGSE